nr:transposase [Paenibacillus tianmuensis]
MYKELGRLGRSCSQLATELRALNQEIIRPCLPVNIILDLDSTVETVRIATSDFEANELDLLIKLLAYNLFERFKRDCCESVHQRYSIARFRLEFFHCAATIIHHSRAIVLKLAKDVANRYAWKRIEAKMALLE